MELFKLLGTIAIDTDKANEAIDETTKKAKDSEGKQSGAFKKIGGAAVAGAKVIAGAATAVGGAWLGAIEGTREYRVSMGKLETAFAPAVQCPQFLPDRRGSHLLLSHVRHCAGGGGDPLFYGTCR